MFLHYWLLQHAQPLRASKKAGRVPMLLHLARQRGEAAPLERGMRLNASGHPRKTCAPQPHAVGSTGTQKRHVEHALAAVQEEADRLLARLN